MFDAWEDEGALEEIWHESTLTEKRRVMETWKPPDGKLLIPCRIQESKQADQFSTSPPVLSNRVGD